MFASRASARVRCKWTQIAVKMSFDIMRNGGPEMGGDECHFKRIYGYSLVFLYCCCFEFGKLNAIPVLSNDIFGSLCHVAARNQSRCGLKLTLWHLAQSAQQTISISVWLKITWKRQRCANVRRRWKKRRPIHRRHCARPTQCSMWTRWKK